MPQLVQDTLEDGKCITPNSFFASTQLFASMLNVLCSDQWYAPDKNTDSGLY